MEPPCDRCPGFCCCRPARTPVTVVKATEAAVIRAILPYLHESEIGRFEILSDNNGRCPFLQSGWCAIYKSRPNACKDYTCVDSFTPGKPIEEQGPLVKDHQMLFDLLTEEWQLRQQPKSGSQT